MLIPLISNQIDILPSDHWRITKVQSVEGKIVGVRHDFSSINTRIPERF